MSYDYLKGRKCMVWTFMGNSRMYQALAAYGDRLSQVGLFSFKVSRTGIITESGVAISNMLTYINRWPHIKWLLTISNDGTNSIFAALRDNTDGAQDTFLSEIVRIMEKYPWCDGIDIDLEKGDGGIQYMICTHGDGDSISKSPKLQMDYRVELLDGTICYDSKTNGQKELTVGSSEMPDSAFP